MYSGLVPGQQTKGHERCAGIAVGILTIQLHQGEVSIQSGSSIWEGSKK